MYKRSLVIVFTILTLSGCGSSSSSKNTTSSSTISHNGYEYGIITSPITGEKWLDRNLGATKICTKSRDDSTSPYSNDAAYVSDQEDCFGDFYQWGRLTDGHQKKDSSKISSRTTDISNAGVNFITNTSDPYDWIENTTQDTNNIDNSGNLRIAQWSKIDGSSICPNGFKVPTIDELKAETIEDSIQDTDTKNNGNIEVINRDTAFKNFLKFPVSGNKSADGLIYEQGVSSMVWSISATGSSAKSFDFNASNAGNFDNNRASGLNVRCIKN